MQGGNTRLPILTGHFGEKFSPGKVTYGRQPLGGVPPSGVCRWGNSRSRGFARLPGPAVPVAADPGDRGRWAPRGQGRD